MVNECLVSILVPVYNTERYISTCIESCINQTLREIEIIAVDDCSTDNSVQVLLDLQKKDSRLKILTHNKNRGLLDARRTGVECAKGKYILHLDSDDYLDLKTCEEVCLIAEEKKVDMVHFGIKSFYENKVGNKVFIKPNNKEIISNVAETIFLKNGNCVSFNICGFLIKRQVAIDCFFLINNSEKINAGEDILQLYICSFLSKNATSINRYLYFYRRNPLSITRNPDHSSINSACRSHEQVIGLINQITLSAQNSCTKKEKIKYKVIALLKYHIEIYKSRLCNNLLAYIWCIVLSFQHLPRWQSIVKILLAIFSFGKIRI